MISEYLEKALQAYENNKASLINEGIGRHVLIRGDEIVGVWDTYDDALKAGYEKFGVDGQFVVKRISGPVDGVQFFTRDIAECQS